MATDSSPAPSGETTSEEYDPIAAEADAAYERAKQRVSSPPPSGTTVSVHGWRCQECGTAVMLTDAEPLVSCPGCGSPVSSPEPSDAGMPERALPEWVLDYVEPARDDLQLGNKRPDSMAGALVYLADELASTQELLAHVLRRMGITHERHGLDAGYWLDGDPEPQRFTTLNEVLVAYDTMLSRLSRERDEAIKAAVLAERDACAKIASGYRSELFDRQMRRREESGAQMVAHLIRSRSTPTASSQTETEETK